MHDSRYLICICFVHTFCNSQQTPLQSASPKPSSDPDEDDETILKLNDGSTVPAKQLEEVLKRHLDAVEHVMVVGSNKGFLSCILALKTKGSEAEA